jgi:hypothetical protein
VITIDCFEDHYEEWLRHFVPVVKARYVRDYTIWLRFKDGVEGEVDFSQDLWGPVFKPLFNIEYFKKFKIKGTSIEWPNGADFCPEFLHLRALGWEPCEHLRPKRAAARKRRPAARAKRKPRKAAAPRRRVKRPV